MKNFTFFLCKYTNALFFRGAVIIAITLLSLTSLAGQEEQCITMMEPAASISTLDCFDGAPGFNYPIMEVQINIHFIGTAAGNFIPGNPDAASWNNGNYVAKKLLEFLNTKMTLLHECPVHDNDFIGDSRIRFGLYSETSNTSDIHGGVWYWESLQAYQANVNNLPYRGRAIPVRIYDDGPIGGVNGNASTTFPFTIGIFDVYARALANPGSLESAIIRDCAGVLAHEMAHVAGLCHSNYRFNPCKDFDLNVVADCNSPDPNYPGANTCGGSDSNCNQWSAMPQSRNIMGGNLAMDALTHCQWKQFYGWLFNNYGKLDMIRIMPQSDCLPASETPIVILSGEHKVWGTPILLQNPVHIEAGGSLTITCITLLAPGARILVRRGGKLRITNGTLSGLCAEQRHWFIYVEGNADLPQPDPFEPLTNALAAGVVILENANIFGAATAISTKRYEADWNRNYFGGVVYAENSRFYNNVRAVEFMEYRRPNRSYFLDNEFIETPGGNVQNSVGVTIWACRGIGFKQNVFDNLDVAGIYGFDFGADVSEENIFRNNLRGIDIYNTYPLSAHQVSVGRSLNHPNIFMINKPTLSGNPLNAHINSTSTGELENLQVKYNEFYDARAGLIVDGPAYYDVAFNIFEGGLRAVRVANTGNNNINRIRCNWIVKPTFIGISAGGDNGQLRILENNFSGTASQPLWNIEIRPTSLPGRIFFNQGATGQPAGNCFSSPEKAIATILDTETFRYYTPANTVNTPACAPDPDNANNFNYTKTPTFPLQNHTFCADITPFEPPFTFSQLSIARQQKVEAYTQWAAMPQDSVRRQNYDQAIQAKEFILKWLLRDRIEAGAWAEADNLLQAETDAFALRWRFGIKMLSGDYAGAQQALNNLPSGTQDEQWFKETMAISLSFHQNPGTFILNAAQENFLYTVAQSLKADRSYARSLLALLKGERFAPEEDEDKLEFRVELSEPQEIAAKPEPFKVMPNPAYGSFTISFPTSPQALHIEAISIAGNWKMEKMLPGESPAHIDCSHWPSGIYVIVIRQAGEIVHRQKVAVFPNR